MQRGVVWVLFDTPGTEQLVLDLADGGFTAQLLVDPDDVALDSPGLFRRVDLGRDHHR